MTRSGPTVRTVLGDIDVGELGRTDYHEHLFQVSPLLPGDELDDEPASQQEAVLLRASGLAAMVDATPIGLGRNPAALARISRAAGLHIVATTGAHREAHYGSGHWLTALTEEQLEERFVADVLEGMPTVDAGARGIGDGGRRSAHSCRGAEGRHRLLVLDPFERRVLAAVAAAHAQAGAPVMVHLEHGSATFEVLDLLARLGVAADAVVLAHVDRNPDPGLHADLAATGAYLGYDGWARTRDWPDSVLLDCLTVAAELGATDRLLLGGDVARRSRYQAYGGQPGLAYLGSRVIPRLEKAGHADLVESALVRNPRRLLSRAFAAGRPPRPARPHRR